MVQNTNTVPEITDPVKKAHQYRKTMMKDICRAKVIVDTTQIREAMIQIIVIVFLLLFTFILLYYIRRNIQ